MSEQQAESSEQTPPEGTEQQQESKTFDAEYVEKLRKEAAKYRTEAKANSEAAKRLAAIEEANKTEAERAAERLAAAEKAANDARLEALRYKTATEMRLSDEDAEALSADLSTEEGIRLVAARLAANATTRKKRGNHVPDEGNNPKAKSGREEDRTFVRELFGRANAD